jgi:hypothetical protein
MVVQHGSYALTCKACGWRAATSFVAIAPHLTGDYRATIIDDDWHEIESVGEGGGPDFMDTVRRAARSGAKVLITPLGS